MTTTRKPCGRKKVADPPAAVAGLFGDVSAAEALGICVDVAKARKECSVSPHSGIKPGTLGCVAADLAEAKVYTSSRPIPRIGGDFLRR